MNLVSVYSSSSPPSVFFLVLLNTNFLVVVVVAYFNSIKIRSLSLSLSMFLSLIMQFYHTHTLHSNISSEWRKFTQMYVLSFIILDWLVPFPPSHCFVCPCFSFCFCCFAAASRCVFGQLVVQIFSKFNNLPTIWSLFYSQSHWELYLYMCVCVRVCECLCV